MSGKITHIDTVAAGQKIVVRQIRSTIGHIKPQRDTLKALGLGRIGKVKTHSVNPAVVGMLKSVSHLVEVRLER